jgi:hypothetical protein
VALEVPSAAAFARGSETRAQFRHQLLHAIAIGVEGGIGRSDVALDLLHRHQPQQSDLKPQAGHRHTACILYTSAPHRSHSILSSPRATGRPASVSGVPVVVEPGRDVNRMGVTGRRVGPESGIAAIIAETAGLPGSAAKG